MVSWTQARALKLLLAGQMTETALAAELGLTQGTVSVAVRKLRKQGFLDQKNSWAVTPHAQALKRVLVKNRGDSLEWLLDARLPVLAFLNESPATAVEAAKATGYSLPTVFKALESLKRFGLLARKERKHGLSGFRPEVREFLSAWKKFSVKGAELPATANVYWETARETVFSLPAGAGQVKGTLTGFSRFAEHGIELLASEKYFALKKTGKKWLPFPEKELSPQKILEHALKAAENAREKGLCVLYYVKNREKLGENHAIEGVLAGRESRDWPGLESIEGMAETYNVRLPKRK